MTTVLPFPFCIATITALSLAVPLASQDPDPVRADASMTELRALLQETPALASQDVHAQLRGRVAILDGTVDSIRAARHAIELCLSVNGVIGVVDRLEVARHSGTGALVDRVSEALDRALLAESSATRNWIVDDLPEQGVLIRTSRTGTAAAALADIAEQVPGVRRVELAAGSPTSNPTDAEMLAAIRRLIRRDVWLADASLRLEVREAVAYLSGTMPAEDLLRRAVTLARVPGIANVDSSAVAILGNDDEPRLRRTLAPESDESILAHVNAVLAADARVAGHALEIEVEEGVVLLGGTVPSRVCEDTALQDARNALGVRGVRSSVSVRPEARDKRPPGSK